MHLSSLRIPPRRPPPGDPQGPLWGSPRGSQGVRQGYPEVYPRESTGGPRGEPVELGGTPGSSGATPGIRSLTFFGYGQLAQIDLLTPAPGSLRISPRPQMEGGRLGEGLGRVFIWFYIGKHSQNIAKFNPNESPKSVRSLLIWGGEVVD